MPTDASRFIDLNADVGEEVGDDSAMLEVVTSANIACGGHAGGGEVMRATVAAALKHGVAIGAHVSYLDRENFGRVELQLPSDDVTAAVRLQIASLRAVAGESIVFVKAHGALYNQAMVDTRIASALLDGVVGAGDALGIPAVTALPDSVAAITAVGRGLRVIREGFADRAYQPDGSLLPRSQPGAVLHDVAQVAAHALALANSGRVDTICVHGDTPDSVAMARAVRDALVADGFTLRASSK